MPDTPHELLGVSVGPAGRTYEQDNTIAFTWVSSTAPDAAPTLTLFDKSETAVASITAAQSDSTHYYALFTMPGSEQYMIGRWYALATFSSSARAFVKRFVFRIDRTTADKET